MHVFYWCLTIQLNNNRLLIRFTNKLFTRHFELFFRTIIELSDTYAYQ